MTIFQDILKRLGKTRAVQKLASIPEYIPRVNYKPIQTGSTAKDFAVNLFPQIIASLINAPSNIATGSRDFGKTGFRQATGEKVRTQDYLSALGQFGEGAIDLASIVPGVGIAKSIGKQSIKELLKRGAKTGAKYGAGYGAAVGLQEGKDLSLPEQLRLAGRGAITSGLTGAGLGAGLAGTGALVHKGIKTYKAIPSVQREAGFVNVSGILGKGKKKVEERIESIRSRAFKDIEVSTKKDFKLEGSYPESIKNATLYLNRLTNSFEGDKAIPALRHYQRVLGEKEFGKFVSQDLGQNITGQPRNVTSFWTKLEAKAKEKGVVSWKQLEREWTEKVVSTPFPVTKSLIDETAMPQPVIPTQATGGVPKLVGEARKYKSAEEFVKAQFEKKGVFHGTYDTWKKLQDKPLFLAPYEDAAKSYGEIVKGYVPKEGKTLDLTKAGGVSVNQSTGKVIDYTKKFESVFKDILGKGRWDEVDKIIKSIPENIRRDMVGDYGTTREKPFFDWARNNLSDEKNAEMIQAWMDYRFVKNQSKESVYGRWDKVLKYAKESGYDYVKHTGEDMTKSYTFPETIALNPKKSLLTKSQLTDLYSQATGVNSIARVHLGTSTPMDGVYLRFGEPPKKGMTSSNYITGEKEKGVSTYTAYLDPKTNKYIIGLSEEGVAYTPAQDVFATNKQKAYIITGKELQDVGEDAEILLDPKTVKIVKEVNRADITDTQLENYYDGTEITAINKPSFSGFEDTLPMSQQSTNYLLAKLGKLEEPTQGEGYYITHELKKRGITPSPTQATGVPKIPLAEVPPIREVPPVDIPPVDVPPTAVILNTRLAQRIADPKSIVDADAHVRATTEGVTVLSTKAEQIKKYINDNQLDPVTVGKLWDEEIPAPNPAYQEAVKQLKDLNDEIFEVRKSGGEVGYNPKMPHVFDQEIDELAEFFISHSNTSPILDALMTDPHRLTRKGTGVGYLQDPVDAVVTSGTRAIQDYLKPLTVIQREVIDHVKKLENNKEINYIAKLSEGEQKRGVIAYEVGGTFPVSFKAVSPLRQRSNLMESIPELNNVYHNLIESFDLIPQRQMDTLQFIDANNIPGGIKYVMDLVNPNDPTAFIARSQQLISKVGLTSYISRMLSLVRKKKLQEFIDTAKSYDYKDPKTERVVNKFIDNELKLDQSKKNLVETGFNVINRIFSFAQIGGNLKVAAIQILDTLRLPANYNLIEISSGIKKAIAGTFTLERKYGFQDSYNAWVRESGLGAGWEKALKIPEAILYGPLKMNEGFKNRIYIGTAEARGISKGLQGDELIRFVRKEVLKRGNIAHRETIPLFLKDAAWNRSLFQYSQFAIKNLIEMKDAVDEKRYAQAVALLAANSLGALIIATLTGYGVSKAIQGIFPAGFGPITSVPVDIISNLGEWQEKDEEGTSTAYNEQRIKDLVIGSFVPGGSQYNKTSKMADILSKGYAETPSGRVKYQAPTDPGEQLKGLILGQSSTPTQQEFYSGERKGRSLGERQTEDFKLLNASDPVLAKAFYDDLSEPSEDKKDKKLVKDILSGKINSKLTVSDIVPESRNSPAGIKTLDQILVENAEQTEKDAAISRILISNKYSTLTPQQKQAFVEIKGGTPEYMEGYYQRKLTSLNPKDTADWIIGQGANIDWTQLYKWNALTPEVAKELERKGFIEDADVLMENMKMTDVYYQRKALRKARAKTVKGILTAQATTKKRLITAGATGRKSIRTLISRQSARSRALRKRLARKQYTPKIPKLNTLPQAKSYKFSIPKASFQ